MTTLPPDVDLCQIPAAKAPEGWHTNLSNPPTLSPVTIAIITILTTWALTFAIIRLFVNRNKLRLADYFIAAGIILSVTYSGLIISLHQYNRHMWDVPVCWLTPGYLKTIFAHTTIVGSVLFFPKCAILIMFLDIFEVRFLMRLAIWFGLLFTFGIYFPSIPLSAIYEAPKPGKSWEDLLLSLATSDENDHTLVYWGVAQGASSVFLDIFIFVLPLPLLARLRLPPKRKLQLIALFGTALAGVAASATALVFRIRLIQTSDSTWVQAQLAITVVVENTVAIVVGCMPAFAKFCRLYIYDLPPIQLLRSKMSRSSHGSSRTPIPLPNGTFGSPKANTKNAHYYELTESTLTQTQVLASQAQDPSRVAFVHEGEPGIMRTVSLTQDSLVENTTHSTKQVV
ncbi:hypothetical protein F4679DRAFT_598018 [Xylaria curta]|nr:hypothetical protein F4679DRAFT_598018 [Xylaria curta]